MTLFKQIALLVTVAIILLLLVVENSDLRRVSAYQQGQLQTTAQDMATTLGIALSNLPESSDPAAVETLFNAVFDSGYYTRLELIAPDGSIIHRKSQALEIEGVPAWFIDLVPLTTASGSAQVMQGWTRIGKLEIEIHPGFVYRGLYESLLANLWGVVWLFAGLMLFLWLFLHHLMKPLQRVREQAEAIHENRFVIQEDIPMTVELKRVVEAMNMMVSRLRGIFREQERALDLYQQSLYRDKLTNLGNRQYLLGLLQQTRSEDSSQYGHMAIIKIYDFERFRDRHGYETADDLIRMIADLLKKSHAGVEVDNVSRLKEGEFAFMSADDEGVVCEYIQALFDRFRELTGDELPFRDLQLQAGVAALHGGGGIGAVLSNIDYCLSRAYSRGPYSIECMRATNFDLPSGKMHWRSWLDSVLDAHQFFLVGQLAVDRHKRPVHREVFVRARDLGGKVIPAGAFMPMATSLGMGHEIDREVITLVTDRLGDESDIPLAINLSSAFFELAGAREELDRLMVACEKQNRRICIETSHTILLQHAEMCELVSKQIHRHQHQFGIDNIDLGLPLKLLQSVRSDYVKINAQTLHTDGGDSHQSAFRALKTLSSTLDIEIIAVAVDSKQVYDRVLALGVEVMQGDFLDQAKEL